MRVFHTVKVELEADAHWSELVDRVNVNVPPWAVVTIAVESEHGRPGEPTESRQLVFRWGTEE